MPALNFKPEFAAAVEAGTKLQTIRSMTCFKVGDEIRLTKYLGPTCFMHKIGDGIIESVEPIMIDYNVMCLLSGKFMFQDERDLIINAEGFKGAIPFYEFFKENYGLPFEGYLIKWRLK